MGNFKIEIEAVGGHGADRTAKQGESLNLGESRPSNPDAFAAEFVKQLAQNNSVVSATLTHWPDTTPIVDDIKNGKRVARDFSMPWGTNENEPILRYFAFHHLPEKLQGVSKSFCHAAYAIVATLPRNAERTVALRKLLEAKDAAVRAALTE